MTTHGPVEVYLDYISAPCRSVHIFLNCLHIPHVVHTVALRRGVHKMPHFTEINPMQKVPVMVDNGLVLTQSDAILKYLATKYNVPDHWYPRQPERRAKVDEYTAWHHSNFQPLSTSVFKQETGTSDLSQLADALDKLESVFLRSQPFLCGDDITVADLLAVCEITQNAAWSGDVLQRRPQLLQWSGRVQSTVGDTFNKAHSVLYDTIKRRRAKL